MDNTWARRIPWTIVLVSTTLVFVGCLAIARSEELTGSDGRYLARQVLWSLFGAAAVLLAAIPNYRLLARWSYAALAASLALLVVVYFCVPVNAAHRWIRLGFISLQPSEFAKLAFVLALARYLMYRESYRQLTGLLAPLALVLVPVLLILKEPDLGTSLIFIPVLFVMLFAAGARLQHMALVAVAAVALTPLLWSQMSREQRSRITALAEPARPGETPTDDGFHLYQAEQMFALGNVWGSFVLGDAVDDPSVYSVPEPQTDSIVSVLGERFGLWGFALLLALFLLLVWRGLAVAASTREPFGRLVAIGITALLAVQMLINTGMMVGLLPITGVSLPLVSYGGSGLLANCLAIGLLINIAIRPGYEVAAEPFRFPASRHAARA